MMKLEKVIGLTSLSNASISTTRSCADTYYAAGNCVVRYNVDDNLQRSFYRVSNAVSCLAVSFDGKYLAVGERCQFPSITVWNIITGVQLTVNSTHKHGISSLAFSPDSQYLVSAGFKHDKQLILWDWEAARKLCVQKLGNKVNSMTFNYDGSFFVTCGDRHLKWWYLTTGKNADGSIDITGKAASILETHKNAVFMDIKIGIDNFVYCATSTGLLCAFNDTRYMKMWIQLESRVSYSVALLENAGADICQNVVIIGSSEGYIRAFSAKDLHYIATLPLPEPSMGSFSKPAATLALCIVHPNLNKRKTGAPPPARKLVAVYGDRSLFIWNIADIHNAYHHRSFFYHTACIWDVQFINTSSSGNPCFPRGTFVTCSADSTIRFWNDDPSLQVSPRKGPSASVSDQAPREMLHMLHIASSTPSTSETSSSSQHKSELSGGSTSSLTRTIADVATGLTRCLTDPLVGIPDLEIPDRPQTPSAPRALAVHPSGRELVCGDRAGVLRVIDLPSMEQRHGTHAHAAELLTLHYSPAMYVQADMEWAADAPDADADMGEMTRRESLVLLASAGRDRLVHVFNASEEYRLVSTLDNHSSPVTTVRFTPDGKRLISCSADKTMAFSSVSGTDIDLLKIVPTPHGTVNGLAIEASNKFAVTSGQNCRLAIWNLQSGKNVRTYKTDAVKGELYKSDTDPSGMYVAACAFDRTVSLFDFFSGKLLAQVSGHSEIITSVRFSPNGRYLLSVGGDGCIMKWSLGEHLVEGIQERLLELATAHKLKMTRLPAYVPARAESRRDGGAKHVPDIMSSLPPPPPVPMRRDSEAFPTAQRASSSSSSSSSSGGGVRTSGARDTTSRDRDRDRVREGANRIRRVADVDSEERSRLEEVEEEEDNRVFRGPPKGKESKVHSTDLIAEGCEGKDQDESESEIVDSLDGERDDATEMANRQLDGLESWLEELLKAETAESPAVRDIEHSADAEIRGKRDNILGMSLSSKFFDNLTLSGDAKESKGVGRKGGTPTAVSASQGAEAHADKGDDVAALKARLRSMGVLGATVMSPDQPSSRRGSSGDRSGLHFESELDTCTTTNSSSESDRLRRALLRGMYLEQEEELRVKAAHCKEVVSNLKLAKEAAAASFRDLALLRANVDRTIASTYSARDSTSDSSTPPPPMDTDRDRGTSRPAGAYEEDLDRVVFQDPFERSLVILETDALLQHYNQNFSEPSDARHSIGDLSAFRAARGDAASTSTSGAMSRTLPFVPIDDAVPDGMKEQEIFTFLDKYSDRLADMVQQKVAAKEKERAASR